MDNNYRHEDNDTDNLDHWYGGLTNTPIATAIAVLLGIITGILIYNFFIL